MFEQEFHRYFRPQPFPSSDIPLGARSVGLYKVLPPWREEPFRKSFFQVFWSVEGSGRVIIEDTEYILSPGMIAVYVPGMVHKVEAPEGPWTFRWWTMDGDEASAIVSRFGIHPGVYMVGEPPEDIFGELEQYISGFGKDDEYEAGVLIYKLLSFLAARIKEGENSYPHSPQLKKVINICRRYWANPRCNVQFLADSVGLHRSYLSRLFMSALGSGPNEFLSRMRINNACSLLRETDMSIAEIAQRCGFSDPDYFTRVFKKIMGTTAGQYRRGGDEEAF